MSAVGLPRRFYTFLWFTVLLFIALFFLSARDDPLASIPSPSNDWKVPFTTDTGLLSYFGHSRSKNPTRIALLETGGTHDEVSAALLHSFGGMKDAELRLYFKNQRYEMPEIMANFTLNSPVMSLNRSIEFQNACYSDTPPDVVVSTTCELDLNLDSIAVPLRHLLANSTTHLFCLVHHADRWHRGKHVNVVNEYLAQGRLDFISLSQHTGEFFVNQTVPTWVNEPRPDWDLNAEIRVRVLPPLFPVWVPPLNPADELSLAMQGDYSPSRRNYQAIFGQLGSVLRKLREAKVLNPVTQQQQTASLRLVGHGQPPQVPEHLRNHVHFDHDLSYPDFYAIMSRAFAIIPAFASETYYDRKASSSVPAALIAGAPIVASERLLETYTYLPREATWVAYEGETELDVIERVIKDKDEYLLKTERVKAAAVQIMEDNRAHVKEWLDFAAEIKEQKVKEADERARIAAQEAPPAPAQPAPQPKQ